MGYQIEWDAALESLSKMHKRGIRVLPGGDYGFAMTPHCQNARDLEFFVKYLGMTPMEAIVSATKYGGQIMMQGHELGEIKEGYLADLILVDGDPLSNLAVLREPVAHAGGDEGRRVLQDAGDPLGALARCDDGGLMRFAWRKWIVVGRDRRPAPRVRDLGDREQRATVLRHAAERPDARRAVLHRGERLHAGVRPDAQRQPRARLAVPPRRLRRLRRRRAHRLVAARARPRASRPPRSPGS